MAWDPITGHNWNEDAVDRARRHNQRVAAAWRKREEVFAEARRQKAIQVAALTPVKGKPLSMKVYPMFQGLTEKLKQARGNFSLFHFTLQFGRLRIELSRAKNIER